MRGALPNMMRVRRMEKAPRWCKTTGFSVAVVRISAGGWYATEYPLR